MRIYLAAAAAIGMLGLAGAASAQTMTDPQWTVSAGYGHYSGKEYGTLGALTGRVGARLHPNFGVEGEASFGVSSDVVSNTLTKTDIDLKYDLGAYAVGYVPVTENFELFARVGYGTTKLDVERKGVKLDDRAFGGGSSINYGVGAVYNFTPNMGVRVDWTRRDMRNSGPNSDVYSLSYAHRF